MINKNVLKCLLSFKVKQSCTETMYKQTSSIEHKSVIVVLKISHHKLIKKKKMKRIMQIRN